MISIRKLIGAIASRRYDEIRLTKRRPQHSKISIVWGAA